MSRKRRKGRRKKTNAPPNEAPDANVDPGSATESERRSEAPHTQHRSLFRRSWVKILIGLVAIGSPIIAYQVYYRASLKPVRFAAGQKGGRYIEIVEAVCAKIPSAAAGIGFNDIDDPLPIKTRGALDNVRNLIAGEADFALYQASILESLQVAEFRNLDGYVAESETGAPIRNSGDDRLDQRELAGHRPEGEAKPEDKAAQEFKTLDTDGNGKISLKEFNDTSNLRFVANVYTEYVHIIATRKSGIKSIEDLKEFKATNGRPARISLGDDWTGSFAMTLPLLEYMGWLSLERFDESPWKIDEYLGAHIDRRDGEWGADGGSYFDWLFDELKKESLDVVIITAGLHADGLDRLLGPDSGLAVDLVPFEAAAANGIKSNQVALHLVEIPAGTYRQDVPQGNTQTFAVRCELLTRSNIDPRAVKLVASILLDRQFQKELGLGELYRNTAQGQYDYVKNAPSFPVHRGAREIYDPGGFDAEKFQNYESAYALISSMVIALFLAGRWLLERRRRAQKHRLDDYLRTLFDLEDRQVNLDIVPGQNDLSKLQSLLREVTALRRSGISNFDANEFKEDPAVHAFLELSHYLSERINAKISRQRLDLLFVRLDQQRMSERVDELSQNGPAPE